MTQGTAGLVASLERELGLIDQQIAQLQAYRATVQQTLELHQRVHAPRLRAVGPPALAASVTPTPASPDDAVPGEVPPTDSIPTTIEMARTVLRNAGRALNLPAIRTAIRNTYGVEPADSLDQMLYKRAQKRKGFYKTPDGEFGLVEDTPVDAPVPSTALA